MTGDPRILHSGLSPLARGNPTRHFGCSTSPGPIPARAGEPVALYDLARELGAYPRSRGGTILVTATALAFSGLSPLARGNRGDGERGLRACGPIPARAGEPTGKHSQSGQQRAYPRSRGGTVIPVLPDFHS